MRRDDDWDLPGYTQQWRNEVRDEREAEENERLVEGKDYTGPVGVTQVGPFVSLQLRKKPDGHWECVILRTAEEVAEGARLFNASKERKERSVRC